MKSILIALLLCISSFASAQNFGKQVNFFSDNAGPHFGLQYAYDQDALWSLTSALWGRDLSPDGTMTTLAWRLFDSGSGQYLNSWVTAVNNSTPIMYPGTMAQGFRLSGRSEILEASKALPNLKLVLSIDQDLSAPVPTHFVDLGAYCTSSAGHFMNLTTGDAGCGVNRKLSSIAAAEPVLAKFDVACVGQSRESRGTVDANLTGTIFVFNSKQAGTLKLGSVGIFDFTADFQFRLTPQNNGFVTFSFRDGQGRVLSNSSVELPKKDVIRKAIVYNDPVSGAEAKVRCAISPVQM